VRRVVCPKLSNGGVPFAFTDANVRNSFQYFYAVTAFDVNSVVSGPSSLESPRVTKAVTPRVASGQQTAGVLQPVALLGATASRFPPAPRRRSTLPPGVLRRAPANRWRDARSRRLLAGSAGGRSVTTDDRLGASGRCAEQRPGVDLLYAGAGRGCGLSLVVPLAIDDGFWRLRR